MPAFPPSASITSCEDIERGGVLLAVHAAPIDLDTIRELLASARPRELDVVNWEK